ncbi:unnamed protein product, partial [Ixodes hexagonus]
MVPATPVPASPAPGPDGPQSWTVAYAAAWNTFCGALLRRSAPVLFGPISDAFMGSRRQPTAWLITLIYSFAFATGPLVSTVIRNQVPSLQTLSLCATLCIGISQVISFFMADLFPFVLVLGIVCGVGSGMTMMVNETILSMYFLKGRGTASNMCYCGTVLAAVVYPVVLLKLVDVYGLHGALLITGGLTFNGLAGSVILSKWRCEGPCPCSIQRAFNSRSVKRTGSMGPFYDNAVKAIGARDLAQPGHHPKLVGSRTQGANQIYARALFATSGRVRRAAGWDWGTSPDEPGGGDDVPGAATRRALEEETQFRTEINHVREDNDGEMSPNREGVTQTNAAVDAGFGGSMFAPMAVLCSMLLAPTFSVVTLLFDFVADELQLGTVAGIAVLVGAAVGDLVARLQAQALFKAAEIRQVLAVECFINGGCLFLLAMIKIGPVLFVVALALGWTSGSFVMILMPLLSTFLLSSSVRRTAIVCRFALAAALPVGPILVGSLKDEGGSYTWLFVLAGGTSVVGGFIWLPGILTSEPKFRAGVSLLAASGGEEHLGLHGGAILS